MFENLTNQFNGLFGKIASGMCRLTMFDGIVEKQYNDLKSNYTKEHEELFCKNIDFLLKNM